MATSPPSPPTPPAPPTSTPKHVPPPKREVHIVSHCTLFYWWPVWLFGFIMFLITAFTGEKMLTVPADANLRKPVEEREELHYHLVVSKKHALPEDKEGKPLQPHLWMTANKNLGVLFIMILLLVIVVTNVPFRGLWSAIVIGAIVTLSILFAYLGWWAEILTWFSFLDIRINAAGYLVISVVLFLLWLFVMLLFDRQIYLLIQPGQLRVKLEIGGAETIYTTEHMQAEKKPSDFFRHWVLGLWTAGDLVIKPANAPEIHFPNVLMISSKMRKIEEMLQVKQVEAAGRPGS